MFNELKDINSRPAPFQFYTAKELWTDEHTSNQMLAYHLNELVDASSRNKKFIERSVGPQIAIMRLKSFQLHSKTRRNFLVTVVKFDL